MEKKSFPQMVITERLVLRGYRREDAAGMLEMVKQNRAELIREFAQMAGLQKLEHAETFVIEKHEQWNCGKTFCYGIWRKEVNGPIGQIQVKNITWESLGAELGYFIDKRWQRQGHATESVKGIVRLAVEELGFERIFVRILPSNSESFALAKKLGFQEEGVQRKAFRCGFGELHDVRYLSLTREDYERLQQREPA
jgi:ribosomal-protein-serine acetyltransferase